MDQTLSTLSFPKEREAATYTLADLTALSEEYQVAKAGDSTEGLRRLFITGWMTWLKEREATLIEEGE